MSSLCRQEQLLKFVLQLSSHYGKTPKTAVLTKIGTVLYMQYGYKQGDFQLQLYVVFNIWPKLNQTTHVSRGFMECISE